MAARFDRSVGVTFIGRDKSASKALQNIGKKADGMGAKFKKAAGVAAKALAAVAAAAAAAAIKIGVDSVKAASDLQETLSKTRELFGDAASAVESFADKAATSLGQSKRQALDAASTFAIFGKSAGLSGQRLVDFTTDLVTLSSDLASFNNTSPEEAVQALGAALRGENEPIRRYGVLINEAALEQQAIRMGIIKTTKDALTPQQKVLVASRLIFKQTTAAQGDFARTSDGLANKQRILAAQFEDVKSRIGQSLLPILEDLADFAVKKLVPAIEAIVDGFTGNTGLGVSADVASGHLKDLNKSTLGPLESTAFKLGETLSEVAKAMGILDSEGVAMKDGGFVKFLETVNTLLSETLNLVLSNRRNFVVLQKIIRDPSSVFWSAEKAERWVNQQTNTYVDPVTGMVRPGRPNGRAIGGTVMSGGTYLVGERGPELLRMGSSGGRIIPNHQLGRGGMNVTVVVQGSVIAERDLAVSVRNQIAQMMRRQGANPAVLGVGR